MPTDILTRQPPPADRRLAYGKEEPQFIDFRYPAGAATHPPLAVMIHGGFWRARYDLLHAGHLCAALTQAGFVTANIEYRRVGDSGGGWPGSFEDVQSAIRFAREQTGARRVIVLGHSAGGHLALRIAPEDNRLNGIVALAPVADLQRAADLHLSNDAVAAFLGGSIDKLPDACPLNHPAAVPRVLFHGAGDDIVPIELSRGYAKARAKDRGGVKLFELPGAGHFDLIDPQSAAWLTIEAISLTVCFTSSSVV